MKRILTIVIAILLTAGSFHSVAANHWADEYYASLTEAGILNADFGERQNEKDKRITRAEFTVLVISTAYGTQKPVSSLPHFADFSGVKPALSGYIAAAYENGVIMGTERSGAYYLNPDELITRQEAVTILGRAIGLRIDLPPEFTDADEIAEYAAPYVTAFEKIAVITGYDDGTFRPSAGITWAESVKIAEYSRRAGLFAPPKFEVILGNNARGSYDQSTGLASFNSPNAILVEGSHIYIADTNNNLIRYADGSDVSIYAGMMMGFDLRDKALPGLHNDKRLSSLFARPTDLLRYDGDMLVLDRGNHVIRRINQNGAVLTYAGTGSVGSRDGMREAAEFNVPEGFCTDESGNIYIADTGNHTIRKISADGIVSTIAGSAGVFGYADGEEALFSSPMGIAWRGGLLYVADTGNHAIRLIDTDGTVSTIAGTDSGIYDDEGNHAGDYRDGTAENSYFNYPVDICFGSNGELYIADMINGMVRRYKDGVVSTVAGLTNTDNIYYFISPRGLYFADGSLYVADSFLNTIVRIDGLN